MIENPIRLQTNSVWNAAAGDLVVRGTVQAGAWTLTKLGVGTLCYSNTLVTLGGLMINTGTCLVVGGSLTNQGITWGLTPSAFLVGLGGAFVSSPTNPISGDFALKSSVILAGTNEARPTTWDLGGNVLRMDVSAASLTIADGATVTNNTFAFVGYPPTGNYPVASCRVTVTNGGQWAVRGVLIGRHRSGTSIRVYDNGVHIGGQNPVTEQFSVFNLMGGHLTVGYCEPGGGFARTTTVSSPGVA